MRLSQTQRLATTTSLFVAGVLWPCRARAYEARVRAEHAAQFYEVRGANGPSLLRRRHTSTLGLELDDLAGSGEGDPNLRFRARLRVDADFGQAAAERNPEGNRFIPGLEQAPFDLMYGYFEAPGLAGGVLNVRLGRQLLIDPLGFWLLDGGRVEILLPLGLELGAYAGLEPRPGLPMLATARFNADGVIRGDRTSLEDGQEPSFLDESRLAPAYGAWFGLRGLGPLSAAVQYRRVENRSPVRLSPFSASPSAPVPTYAAARTSSERVSASARLDVARVGSASATTVYDLYRARTSDVDAGITLSPLRTLGVHATFTRHKPTFDGDSIFNWFTQGATSRVASGVDLAPARALDVSLSWGVRWFETEGDPDARASTDRQSSGTQLDGASLGASLATRWRLSPSELALSAHAEAGDRGHLYGADLSVRRSFDGGLYDALALVSLYDWAEPLREERDATSFGYVVGAGMRTGTVLFDHSRLGLEWEHTMNRLVAHRFRLLATLAVEVFR